MRALRSQGVLVDVLGEELKSRAVEVIHWNCQIVFFLCLTSLGVESMRFDSIHILFFFLVLK